MKNIYSSEYSEQYFAHLDIYKTLCKKLKSSKAFKSFDPVFGFAINPNLRWFSRYRIFKNKSNFYSRGIDLFCLFDTDLTLKERYLASYKEITVLNSFLVREIMLSNDILPIFDLMLHHLSFLYEGYIRFSTNITFQLRINALDLIKELFNFINLSIEKVATPRVPLNLNDIEIISYEMLSNILNDLVEDELIVPEIIDPFMIRALVKILPHNSLIRAVGIRSYLVLQEYSNNTAETKKDIKNLETQEIIVRSSITTLDPEKQFCFKFTNLAGNQDSLYSFGCGSKLIQSNRLLMKMKTKMLKEISK